jgi:hypothetical protein
MRTQPIENGSTMPTLGAAYNANGRRAKEDAATEETTNKEGSSPRRKSENNAAEFPAKQREALKG